MNLQAKVYNQWDLELEPHIAILSIWGEYLDMLHGIISILMAQFSNCEINVKCVLYTVTGMDAPCKSPLSLDLSDCVWVSRSLCRMEDLMSLLLWNPYAQRSINLGCMKKQGIFTTI